MRNDYQKKNENISGAYGNILFHIDKTMRNLYRCPVRRTIHLWGQAIDASLTWWAVWGVIKGVQAEKSTGYINMSHVQPSWIKSREFLLFIIYQLLCNSFFLLLSLYNSYTIYTQCLGSSFPPGPNLRAKLVIPEQSSSMTLCLYREPLGTMHRFNRSQL